MIVFAFVILTVLGIWSTCMNTFLLIVFLKDLRLQGFSTLKKLPYFIYCFQILICNLCGLVVKFIYVIPLAAWDNDKSTMSEPYIAAMAIIETLVYHGELFFILALAIHRLFIFFGLSFASEFKFCLAQIIFIWFLVFLFVGGQILFDCFDTSITPNSIENNNYFDDVKFYSVCDTSTLPKEIFKILTTIINDYLPIITLVLYAMIVAKIRYNQYKNNVPVAAATNKSGGGTNAITPARKKQNHDLIIFFQAFVIYGCFFFKFRILNGIGYSDTSHSVLMKCLIYVSIYVRDTTQAVFMLAFNQNVKNIAKNILCRSQANNTVFKLTSSRVGTRSENLEN